MKSAEMSCSPWSRAAAFERHYLGSTLPGQIQSSHTDSSPHRSEEPRCRTSQESGSSPCCPPGSLKEAKDEVNMFQFKAQLIVKTSVNQFYVMEILYSHHSPISLIKSVMASWTDPPNTPECRSLHPHCTFKYEETNATFSVWSQTSPHNISGLYKKKTVQEL